MIISISGTPGSGKTTLANFLSGKLRMKEYLVGEMVRKIAEKKGISIVALDKKAVSDRAIDREIDKIHLKLKNKDNFIIDSRVAFKFFPKSLKIFLYCSPAVAAKRIFESKRETERMNLKKTLQEVRQRNRLDRLRYKKYYGIDLDYAGNYDIIVDTSRMIINEMCNTILKAAEKFRN
ncbi:MAG: cytidylate kinase family protein [archaeon]